MLTLNYGTKKATSNSMHFKNVLPSVGFTPYHHTGADCHSNQVIYAVYSWCCCLHHLIQVTSGFPGFEGGSLLIGVCCHGNLCYKPNLLQRWLYLRLEINKYGSLLMNQLAQHSVTIPGRSLCEQRAGGCGAFRSLSFMSKV